MEQYDVKNQFINPDFRNSNNTFNFSKYEDYQKMLKDLERLEKHYKRIPEEEMQERLECSQEINQQKEMIEAYKQEVLRLAETFSKIEINTERLRQAKAYFDEGKLREADAILKPEDLQNDQKTSLSAKEQKTKELAEIDQNLRNNATEFLLKAQLRATQFDEGRLPETIAFYEQALASYRSPENLFAYAYFLAEHNQFKEATPLYQEALVIRRKLAEANPEAYLPDVAMTLNNLAILLQAQGQLGQAKEVYQEALGMRRKLAEANPEAYLPDVAGTLNNLGVLLKAQGQFGQAKEAYQEALGIYRNLAEAHPEAYLPDVAMTLNNLGALHYAQGQFVQAKEVYEECLGIRVRLYQKNQRAYAPALAEISANYAIFYLQAEGHQDREVSIQLCQQCILVGFPVAEQMPRLMQIVQTAIKVLRAWDFDVEVWLNSLQNPER